MVAETSNLHLQITSREDEGDFSSLKSEGEEAKLDFFNYTAENLLSDPNCKNLSLKIPFRETQQIMRSYVPERKLCDTTSIHSWI